MSHAFEQLPKESAKAFAAFKDYLDMGAERSLEAVAQKFTKSSRLLKRWSVKYDWQARVAAHGAHLAVVEREAIEAAARGKAAEWECREAKVARNGMGDARSGHRRREKGAGCLHGKRQGLCQPRGHRPDAGNREQTWPAGDRTRHRGRSAGKATICRGCGSRSRWRWKKYTGMPKWQRHRPLWTCKPCRCCRKKPHDALGTIFSGRSPRWLPESDKWTGSPAPK